MNSSLIFDQKTMSLPSVQFHPLLNILGIIPSAFIVTSILLYAMYLLVHKDYPIVVPPTHPPMPQIIADFPKVIPVMQEALPVKPIEQTPPPSVNIVEPMEVDSNPGAGFGGPVVITKPPITGVFGIGGQMVPVIKIAPQYPQAAAAKGTEGYVDILFDVTTLGTTENIRIIAYVPSAVFNKSVIKAVQGWKYKPNVVDGAPVKTYDVKDRVRFAMEK
ncbi:energy transducer TonB [Cellvibrio sp. OA-2007]|uniref:energy transducer TonB n=1 Tax=Cellvibrio sp. OA-2007 TaxID=529823 RepID=UPI000783EF58|nr:TonB family protein [Cellvibrio sp. OA-2007]